MTTPLMRTVLLAALLLASSFGVQAAIDMNAPLPIGPQVKVGKLPNGLSYYIQKNARPEKKLELRLVIKAGSILEDDDQQGLAHFTEHMAFNGSAHFKKHELVSYLQSIGVKFGADLNAYTSFDETVYILPIPTDRKDNIDKGFLVLQDWAGGLTLNTADIDKERGIILEERRMGKGAGDRMNKVLVPKIYNGSRYAQRLPIGQEHTLKTFKPEALRRFYRDWYRPDLMAVVVVGDIDPAYAEQMIVTHFGKLTNPARPRPREYARIPVRAKTEALVVTDKEASNNGLLIRYPVSEVREKLTLGGYRDKLVEALFSGMLNTRLQDLSQLAEPPFMGGSSGISKLTARYKSYNAAAALGKAGALPAIEALVQENMRARQYGFGAAELARAKKNMMRNYERAWIERDKTDSSSYVGEYVRNFLEQESIPGIENEYRYAQELIPAITLDEMNRFARGSIPADTAKLVIYTGSSKGDTPIPTTAQLLAAVEAAEKSVVAEREVKNIAASLMATPPAPGSIVGETVDKALGTTTLSLSNGLSVILKPTDFRNDQVLVSASRFGGHTLFDEKDSFIARYATAVVGTMGVNGHSPLEVQKILAGKTATARLTLSTYTESVGGSAGSGDIETLLQLMHLQFTSVRRDEDLYKSFIGNQVEAARNAMAQPEAVFRDTILGTLYNNHPRVARMPRPEDFAKVSLDGSLAIYRQRFSSARGLTFIMAGSFDIDKVKPLVATYLASLPVGDIAVGFRDVGVRPVTGIVKKDVFRGAEAKSNVSLSFTGKADWSAEEELRFFAMIEVLNIRITDVLREKMALIYGGGLSGSLNQVPYGNYAIAASLPTGPDKVDKVIAATFAEIRRMQEQGPAAADLEKVRQNWLQRHQTLLRENGYWINRLQNALMQGSDLGAILQYEQKVAQLTPAQLQDAARRYFKFDNYVQVVLYPEKKAH
jgi:zinc protease